MNKLKELDNESLMTITNVVIDSSSIQNLKYDLIKELIERVEELREQSKEYGLCRCEAKELEQLDNLLNILG